MQDNFTDASLRLGHKLLQTTFYYFCLKKGYAPNDCEIEAKKLMKVYKPDGNNKTKYDELPRWVKDACLKVCEGEVH